MPQLPHRECCAPRCAAYALAGSGYCAAHRNYLNGPAALHLTNTNRRFRWLRGAFLKRQPMCSHCHTEPATDLDHKIPHRGNARLFWDQSNWQGLCHRCHSMKTATEMV